MRNNEETYTWTTEDLQMHTDRCYGAVLQHGDYVLVSDLVWIKGEGQVNDARVYRLAEQPIPGVLSTSRSAIECKLELVTHARQSFEDAGHAIAWCLTQI